VPSDARLSVVDATAGVLARLRRFAGAMDPDLPPVDMALGAVRALLEDARVEFKFVGGLAVVHHGYARTTEDVDVLVESDGPARLRPSLASHGFEAVGEVRLRHIPTGVQVDLLVAGSPMPRAGSGPYPSPASLGASPRDPAVIGLSGLFGLKLRARRHQDLADIVALLKRLDEVRYTEVEAEVDRELRPALADLRRDALEELADERRT
jgi:hypothetical protein